MMKKLTTPIEEEKIRSLGAGEMVQLSGVIVTGRDAAHKWLYDTFISKSRVPNEDDLKVYQAIRPLLENGVVYHCGPVVVREGESYRLTSAGPTTSIRHEPYQAAIIRHFNLRGIVGKGGMGEQTAAALRETGCVYLHAVGGAAVLLAGFIQRVHTVYKLDFGVPEAIWILEVKNFPAVVTMDANGGDLHQQVRQHSEQALRELYANESS